MDLQQMFDNAQAAAKLKRAQASKQFLMMELIFALQSVGDKNKPVVFDDGKMIPTFADSWRGSYSELALNYEPRKEAKPKTAAEWIEILSGCLGKTFEGYKGGDFVMSKITEVWVANYGESSGFKSDEENGGWYQAVVGVEEKPKFISLITETMDV